VRGLYNLRVARRVAAHPSPALDQSTLVIPRLIMASATGEAEKGNDFGSTHEKDHEFRVERSESLDGLPDPDAGKSDEERKKIV
jgi:hypothetical protein